MKAMLIAGCIELNAERHGIFELTNAGRELLESASKVE
jgi:hypothetical protein